MLVAVLYIEWGEGAKARNAFSKTVPFTVIVTEGTIPMEGVNIQLISQTKSEWTAGGTMDATGKLSPSTIQSGYLQKGVPVASYMVTLSKMEESPSAKRTSMEEYRKKQGI
ncbi:MAG: hypothetical protein PHQ75_03075 [Thermoguttaceae bacterium]|nr:hypothetical protein [Thermoguttaceae bacterium]